MILFFLIGVLIMVLGIKVLISEKKKEKSNRLTAVVQNCRESYMDTEASGQGKYEITLEVHTDFGVTYKTINSRDSHNIGEILHVYYDVQEDTVQLTSNVNSNIKGGWAIIGFGAIWCALLALPMLAQTSEKAGEIIGSIFAFGLPLLFVVIGFNLSVVKSMKIKKEMVHCTTVQGRIVDYRTKRSRKHGTTYQPAYGFFYNGEERTIWGSVSSNSSKYRQLGRQVTIVINNKTGDVYCREDQNFSKRFGIMFGLFGLFILIVVCASFFAGDGMSMYNGSSDSGYTRDDTYSLQLNSDGYSTKSISLPSDEKYTEYYYLPGEENGTYGYNIKIYQYGIGVVTIFPLQTTGKGINQVYAFYVDEENIRAVVTDSKEYDFNDLLPAGRKDVEVDGTVNNEYLYFYNGSERIGSGGYGVESALFTYISNNVKSCVPASVWAAIEKEIERYYE